MVLFNNRLARALCFLSIIVSLTLGCTSKAATRPSTILGYNHTSNTIMEYRMTLATGESANGMSLLPHQGGGSFVCCMPMPRKWADNLKVTVNITERINGKDRERQVVVHIPRYDSAYMNYTNVHFLRGGAVKIFVLGTGMRDENYPLTAEEADLGGPK